MTRSDENIFKEDPPGVVAYLYGAKKVVVDLNDYVEKTGRINLCTKAVDLIEQPQIWKCNALNE